MIKLPKNHRMYLLTLKGVDTVHLMQTKPNEAIVRKFASDVEFSVHPELLSISREQAQEYMDTIDREQVIRIRSLTHDFQNISPFNRNTYPLSHFDRLHIIKKASELGINIEEPIDYFNRTPDIEIITPPQVGDIFYSFDYKNSAPDRVRVNEIENIESSIIVESLQYFWTFRVGPERLFKTQTEAQVAFDEYIKTKED